MAKLNKLLQEQSFQKEWKVARVVLLLKQGKEINVPSSYRPIYLLDTFGKLFERIIVNTLNEESWRRIRYYSLTSMVSGFSGLR